MDRTSNSPRRPISHIQRRGLEGNLPVRTVTPGVDRRTGPRRPALCVQAGMGAGKSYASTGKSRPAEGRNTVTCVNFANLNELGAGKGLRAYFIETWDEDVS